jgi:hypothetical protein
VTRAAAAALLALLLAACARAPVTEPPPPQGPLLPLPAPAALGPDRTARYVLRIAYAGGETALQAAVNLAGGKLMLVGVDALGLRLFTLHYDGLGLKTEVAPSAPRGLDPARIIGDALLAYAPLPAWREALAGTPWELTEPAPGSRRLRRGGRLIAEVHYGGDDPWQHRLWVVNFEFGYALALEPLR